MLDVWASTILIGACRKLRLPSALHRNGVVAHDASGRVEGGLASGDFEHGVVEGEFENLHAEVDGVTGEITSRPALGAKRRDAASTLNFEL